MYSFQIFLFIMNAVSIFINLLVISNDNNRFHYFTLKKSQSYIQIC
jgi:hypothetical protein